MRAEFNHKTRELKEGGGWFTSKKVPIFDVYLTVHFDETEREIMQSAGLVEYNFHQTRFRPGLTQKQFDRHLAGKSDEGKGFTWTVEQLLDMHEPHLIVSCFIKNEALQAEHEMRDGLTSLSKQIKFYVENPPQENSTLEL